MQSEGGELVEAVEGELVLPSNRRPLQVTLRHTRNLIICYTLHKVSYICYTHSRFL